MKPKTSAHISHYYYTPIGIICKTLVATTRKWWGSDISISVRNIRNKQDHLALFHEQWLLAIFADASQQLTVFGWLVQLAQQKNIFTSGWVGAYINVNGEWRWRQEQKQFCYVAWQKISGYDVWYRILGASNGARIDFASQSDW